MAYCVDPIFPRARGGGHPDPAAGLPGSTSGFAAGHPGWQRVGAGRRLWAMDDIEQPGRPGPDDDTTPAGPSPSPSPEPAQAPPMAAPPPPYAPPPPPRRLTR